MEKIPISKNEIELDEFLLQIASINLKEFKKLLGSYNIWTVEALKQNWLIQFDENESVANNQKACWDEIFSKYKKILEEINVYGAMMQINLFTNKMNDYKKNNKKRK
jgi:hypothetical protein